MQAAQNETLMQYFEWYLPPSCGLWRQAEQRAENLRDAGITSLWLPPACKGSGGANDVGYATYDLYDLGEFDQKGSVATKYGTKEEYLRAIQALHAQGIKVLADIVLDHKIGADGTEQVQAVCDASNDRGRQVQGEQTISAWTKFSFPGRAGKYSDFQWNWTHFDGIDWDQQSRRSAVFRFHGKDWDAQVDGENGNYDYLMGADLDLSNPQVVRELKRWGKWFLDTTDADGFRIDAAKHIRFSFFPDFLTALRKETGKALFTVGEYWSPSLPTLLAYLQTTQGLFSLFDVPLHYQFHCASRAGGSFDMGSIFNGTLCSADAQHAVTFVDNHDTQPGQALESWVQGWFKPLAYAMILLRAEGIPCVFYGDYYGIPHNGIAPVEKLPALLRARAERAYGVQHDYFDHCNVVGFTREGDEAHPRSGLAAVLSDGPGGVKHMFVGTRLSGASMRDVTGGRQGLVTVSPDGWGDFPVSGGAVSVWVLA